MIFSLLDILQVTGALALFIFGMKVMSDGIQKAAGGQLRKTLRNITKRPINGILVGLIVTGIIQSSSATTVMTISFVNAGLITVAQSAGLIIGANIGTTITAWLVSLGGFLFSLSTITLPILTIAIPVFFRGNQRNKYWAEFFIGFCLIFIGLDFLKDALPSLGNEEVFQFIKNYTSGGILSRLLFVVIGLIITVLVQSSSAALTLFLAMAFNGWIPMDLAAALIIGSNIGTTITAEIAAIVANVYARQSASIHTLFNVFGAIWMILLLPVVMQGVESIMSFFTQIADPWDNANLKTIGLALFHSLFNILNAIILFPLLGYLVIAAQKLRSAKSNKDTKAKLKYIDYSIGTPELSSVEVKMDLMQTSETVERMVHKSNQLFNSTDNSEKKAIFKWLQKKNKQLSKSTKSITKYIIQIAREELSDSTSEDLQRYLRISGDLLRISNLTNNIALELRDKRKEGIWFTPEQRNGVNRLYGHLNDGLTLMRSHLTLKSIGEEELQKARAVEDDINTIRDNLRVSTISRSDEFDFNLKGTLIFFKIFSLLENIGDKLYDINEQLYHK